MTGVSTEAFGALGFMGNIAAFFSMLAALTALSVNAFLAYRIRDDIKAMQEIKDKIAKIDKNSQEQAFISDEVAAVLYDLFNLNSISLAFEQLRSQNRAPADLLDQELSMQLALIEKHFAELGLFSRDQVRRRSVQASLAATYGDLKTLDLMNKIRDGHVGIKEIEIDTAISQLKQRLAREGAAVYDSSSWTGRPSGGRF